MKYKPKDKVKIKTWNDMEIEYGLTSSGNIDCQLVFVKDMEYLLNDMDSNRIVTINYRSSVRDYYTIEEIGGEWSDDMIRYLERDYNNFKNKDLTITSRFDIIDL